jgi:hypothetical protein
MYVTVSEMVCRHDGKMTSSYTWTYYLKLYIIYSVINIVKGIKSRMLQWLPHVSYMRDKKCTQNFGRKSLKGRVHSRGLSVDTRITLKLV